MQTYLAMLALLLTGCEPALTAGVFPAATVDAGGTDAAGADTTVASQGTLTGTWALATEWSTCVDLGDKTETRARTLTKVTITQKGQRLLEQREVCSIQTTPVLGLETIVPPAALAAINPEVLESTVFGPDGTGQGYASGVEVQLWGLKMADALAEAMPTAADDPRIVDSDGDGHAGVTYRLGQACEMYLAQRSLAVVTAVRGPDGAFAGGAVRSNEMFIAGGSQGICQMGHETRSNDKDNVVRMVRVDKAGLDLHPGAGDVTCADIVANASKIVKWLDADDARCQ